MRIIETLKFGFKNYFNFSGRIPRSTFIIWNISTILIRLFAILLSVLIWGFGSSVSLFAFLLLEVLFFFPKLSMSFKRLHDVGLSGWFIFVPIIAVILFVVSEMLQFRSFFSLNSYVIYYVIVIYSIYLLYFKKSVSDNKYGSNPLNNK